MKKPDLDTTSLIRKNKLLKEDTPLQGHKRVNFSKKILASGFEKRKKNPFNNFLLEDIDPSLEDGAVGKEPRSSYVASKNPTATGGCWRVNACRGPWTSVLLEAPS